MYFSTFLKKYRHPWKNTALIFTLLTSVVFGSPVTHSNTFHGVNSSLNQLVNIQDRLQFQETAIDIDSDERSDRKKRFLGDALKKAKQAQLKAIGAASGKTIKKVAKKATKSAVKSIVSFSINALIMNLLYQKINQILEFKSRALGSSSSPQKTRPQNGQRGKGSLNSSTEAVPDDIPEFSPDSVSLQIPNTVVGTSFNVANGASQVFGTLIRNTAERIARLFHAFKPWLSSSSSLKSKKRETATKSVDSDRENNSSLNQSQNEAAESPIKSSYIALTQ